MISEKLKKLAAHEVNALPASQSMCIVSEIGSTVEAINSFFPNLTEFYKFRGKVDDKGNGQILRDRVVYEYESYVEVYGIAFRNLHTQLSTQNGSFREPNIFHPKVIVDFDRAELSVGSRSEINPLDEGTFASGVLRSPFGKVLERDVVLSKPIQIVDGLKSLGVDGGDQAIMLASEVKPFFEQLLEQKTSELGTKQAEVKRIKARLKI